MRGETGSPVADGETGDLYIRGPSAALMYWADREKSRDDVPGRLDPQRRQVPAQPDGNYTYAAAATTC